jgi:hypothetical protein
VKGSRARPEVRGHGGGGLVASEVGRRADARNVFDATSASRAGSSAADRKKTRTGVCADMSSHGEGRLMAQWLGHSFPFQKLDMLSSDHGRLAAKEREEARVRGRVCNVVQIAAGGAH